MTHTTPTTDTTPTLPTRLRGPATFLALLAAALLVLPLILEPFRLNLLAQYLCYAIVALGIALAWGRGGMLTLGHGVYFGLGAYAMAMHLTLANAAQDPLNTTGLPQFMVWSGLTELPWLWQPFTSATLAITAAITIPGALAALLGWSVFRQRVRGAYFAILNQALAAAFVLLIIGQQHLTGGTNGLTDFPVFAGHSLYTPTAQTTLYILTVLTLAATYLLFRHITLSRYGQLLTAIRDGEDRVRYLGYNPTWAKTLAYALSAMAAGAAGALFVPVMGIISPALIGVIPSIMMVLAASHRLRPWQLLRRRRTLPDTVTHILDRVGLTPHTHAKAATLSHGQRQWLEIAMLLAQQPRLLLLDEPVAGMNTDERTRTGDLLTEIATDHTIIVIEHDMDFLRRYAREVTVLHEGRILTHGDVHTVQQDPRVQEVYLGRTPQKATP